ncbi:MAG: CopD family protein [Pseudomonadota bacterium]
MLYLSLKVLHLLAVISWMAGMLYMPRLFVYHHGAAVGGDASETFKIMERKLAKLIMRPALVVMWLAGLALIWVQGHNVLTDIWLITKLLAVVGMTSVHMMYLRFIRAFEADERPKTGRYFRVLNEVPTLLMILVLIMVVFKPGL